MTRIQLNKLITTMILTLIMSVSVSVFAQSGPISPCVDCESFTQRTEPYNGTWYNPEQSGTGFSVDVQNGKVFGVYYGYDEQGKQLWLTFVADLVPSNEDNVMWTIDAELQQFENGNSFNTNYIFPVVTDYLGTIHIKFSQKNHALLSVNGGEEQNIVPIIFGVANSVDFPEQTSYSFPDLEGVWTFVYHYNSNVSVVPVEPFSIISETIVIPKKRFADRNGDGIEDIVYTIYRFDNFPDYHLVGDIICSIKSENDTATGPSCEFIDDRGLFGDVTNKPSYKMSIGGLGAFRLFGEHEDGHTLEGIKVNSKHYNFFE